MGKMEKEVAHQKRQHCRTAALNIITSLCSVASIAFCILLSINAADVKNRVVDLESGKGEHTFIHAAGYSTMDDFNSLIQQRVDELLSQVRLAFALASRELIVLGALLRVTVTGKQIHADASLKNVFAHT